MDGSFIIAAAGAGVVFVLIARAFSKNPTGDSKFLSEWARYAKD